MLHACLGVCSISAYRLPKDVYIIFLWIVACVLSLMYTHKQFFLGVGLDRMPLLCCMKKSVGLAYSLCLHPSVTALRGAPV